MKTDENGTTTGKITHIIDRHALKALDIAVLDVEGRLLCLTYSFPTHEHAEAAYRSLKNGMKVTVTVKGAIVDEISSYQGVGIIRVVADQ